MQIGVAVHDLIDRRAVNAVSGSEIYHAGSGFTRLCPFLSPQIINWVQKEWSEAPIFLRLDVDVFWARQPLQLLAEATLVLANPRWLKDFSLRKGMKDFASYELLGRPLSQGQAEYWDYHVRHLQRLTKQREKSCSIPVIRRQNRLPLFALMEYPHEISNRPHCHSTNTE